MGVVTGMAMYGHAKVRGTIMCWMSDGKKQDEWALWV